MSAEKKVLIITYYWPPSGGSGVQRWLKFVKYLPQFGWQPIVFTPENPSFSTRDETLLNDVPPEAEVIRFPIWEPYDMFFRFSNALGNKSKAQPKNNAGMVPTGKRSFFQKVSMWLRGNLLIPDPRRFWIKPSVAFLEDFILQNKIRTIITTGPPHSMHLIGLGLKKKLPTLNWIADFRDPWSQWGLLDSLSVGAMARKIHTSMEANVLARANTIVTITPFYVRQFKKLAQRKVTLLTNGFDEDDFTSVVIKRTDKFLIRHVGIVNEKCDPRPFMNAIKELLNESPDMQQKLRIEFIGEVHQLFKNDILADEALRDITIFSGSVPHKQLLQMYGESSLLLLVLTGYKDAEGFLPGKLFEYMATGLPVLAVGPVASDAADVLKESEAGEMIDSYDVTSIKNFMKVKFDQWQSGNYVDTKPVMNKKYSRKDITGQLVELLERD